MNLSNNTIRLTIMIAFMLCMRSVFHAGAQGSNFEFTRTRLSQDDGLSQGSNYFMFEDSKGFMWITGNDAINRYDGSSVKVYNLDRYFQGCPNLQQGYGFVEDSQSNVYIGSVRGLYVYHRQTDKFTLLKIYSNSVDDIAMPFGFYAGKIWCYNRSYEIASYDLKTKAIKVVGRVPLPILNSIHVYDMQDDNFYFRFPFIDTSGRAWFLSKNNIVQFNLQTNIVAFPFKDYLAKMNDNIVCAHYLPSDNTLRCGLRHGIVSFDLSKNTIQETRQIGKQRLDDITQLAANSDKIIFRNKTEIFISDKAMTHFQKATTENTTYRRSYRYLFDKSSRFWMSDDGLGLVIFDFNKPLLFKKPNDDGFEWLKESGVSNIAIFPSGNYLVRGSILQNGFTGKLSLFGNMKHDLIDRLRSDPGRHGIWISDVKNKRLVLVNEKAEEQIVINIPYDNYTDRIQDMMVLADGNLIINSTNGIYLVNVNNKKIGKVRGVVPLNSFTMNKLSNQRLAITYLNHDMLLYQMVESDSLHIIQRILPGIQSFYIQEDSVRHRYWVGTNQGVYLLDENFKTVQVFNANNGLAGTYIYGILLDDEGNAYCSHQHGLSSIGAVDFHVVNYDKSDGIQDWDFNNRSFFKAPDGTLFFGGVSGYNYFKPPLIPKEYYKPEVYIDEILVNNVLFSPDSNANNIQQLNLNFDHNTVSFKAILKDLYGGKGKQIIYRIKELDTAWKYLPNTATILFNSLAPQKYTLQLGYFNKYSNTHLLQKTIQINISAPFYKKIWFWLLSGLMGMAVIFGLINRRKLRKQKLLFLQQFALSEQRRKITADLHDDIGASLSSLQVNSVVAQRLIDKDKERTKDVLDKIEEQTRNLSEKIGDIIWSMKPGKEEFISLTGRIKNFANDILGATEMNYSIEAEATLDTLIQDIYQRKNILFITKEAINNCVKYSKAKNVFISLKNVESHIELTIQDNGIGFDCNEKSLGNGLSNMQKRSKELNGICTIESGKEGTKVFCRIPIV